MMPLCLPKTPLPSHLPHVKTGLLIGNSTIHQHFTSSPMFNDQKPTFISLFQQEKHPTDLMGFGGAWAWHHHCEMPGEMPFGIKSHHSQHPSCDVLSLAVWVTIPRSSINTKWGERCLDGMFSESGHTSSPLGVWKPRVWQAKLVWQRNKNDVSPGVEKLNWTKENQGTYGPEILLMKLVGLLPWKLTWHWNMPNFNRKYFFQWWVFCWHVSFLGVSHFFTTKEKTKRWFSRRISETSTILWHLGGRCGPRWRALVTYRRTGSGTPRVHGEPKRCTWMSRKLGSMLSKWVITPIYHIYK